MSFIKRFTEHHEYHCTLVAVLKYLDERDSLPRDESRSIARRIINGENPDNLNTSSQRWSFYNRLEPFLKDIRCENSDCNSLIGISSLEESFNHAGQYGALLCIDCLINRWRECHYNNR